MNQICNVCVMDQSATAISFDDNGRCNFCTTFESRINLRQGQLSSRLAITDLVEKIKETAAASNTIVLLVSQAA